MKKAQEKRAGSSTRPLSLDQPDSSEKDKRADECGKEVLDADRDFSESEIDLEPFENKSTDECAHKADTQIGERTKPLLRSFDHHTGYGTGESSHNEPDDDLTVIQRDLHTTSYFQRGNFQNHIQPQYYNRLRIHGKDQSLRYANRPSPVKVFPPQGLIGSWSIEPLLNVPIIGFDIPKLNISPDDPFLSAARIMPSIISAT